MWAEERGRLMFCRIPIELRFSQESDDFLNHHEVLADCRPLPLAPPPRDVGGLCRLGHSQGLTRPSHLVRNSTRLRQHATWQHALQPG